VSAPTYTYNPANLQGITKDHIRFALGDTLVAGGAETCMLADEEIEAVISEGKSLRQTLYRLADAVCMRLSYEVDFSNDGTSFSLSQRADRWAKIRDKFKTGLSVPTSGAVSDSVQNAEDGGHYFRAGMMQSPYVGSGEET